MRCEFDDVPVRQHDDAESRIVRSAAAANLNDAHRPTTRPTEVGRKVRKHAIGVIVRSVDDGSHVALGVEVHAGFSVSIYFIVYIA
jgi:hypothetical protein